MAKSLCLISAALFIFCACVANANIKIIRPKPAFYTSTCKPRGVCASDKAQNELELFSSRRNFELNWELNDFASYYMDSFDPRCAQIAAQRLAQKLESWLAATHEMVLDPRNEILEEPFQTWLSGLIVTYTFASALNFQLYDIYFSDLLLRNVRDQFKEIANKQDRGCGTIQNSCMEDYVITSSGFAWLSAYEKKRGRDYLGFQQRAKDIASLAFKPIAVDGSLCYSGDSDGLTFDEPTQKYVFSCNGKDSRRLNVTPESLKAIAFDHSQEHVAYGFGNLTILASSCLASWISGLSCASDIGLLNERIQVNEDLSITVREAAIKLAEHAISKTNDPRAFSSTCYSVCVEGNCDVQAWTTPPANNLHCGDQSFFQNGQPIYQPDMFPMKKFFESKIGWMGFENNLEVFDFGDFDPGYNCGSAGVPPRRNFFSYNRFAMYNILANQAWPTGTYNDHFQRINNLSACGAEGEKAQKGLCCPGLGLQGATGLCQY